MKKINASSQLQGSPEWFAFRKKKVTATDAACIMGVGFKNIGQVFDEKLGLREPDPMNDAMKRGLDLEDEAREAFEKETGLFVYPMVIISPTHDFMAASLDGMTIEKDVAVEIKCPGRKVALETFNSKKVPSYYIPQLQHQMAVTGLNEIYYYSYYPEENLSTCLIVSRDQEYIDNMIEKEKKFYHLLKIGISTIECFESDMDRLKDELYKILREEE